MSGMLLPICAIFFSILLCTVFFWKKRINLIENKVYAVMLILGLIDSILVSVLQTFPLNGITTLENTLIIIINKIDFITLIAITNCLFFYTTIITYSKEKAKLKKIFSIALATDIFAIINILFQEVSVISMANNFSVSGMAVNITYIICGIFIFLSIIIALLNIKKADKRYIPIFAIIGILIFLILMFKINPYLIVVSITLTFINYLMYFTIENPDMKMIEQLEIAKDQADKANSAKTDFLSSMSHEIRTPLNAIMGFSDCINNATSLEEAKENAKDIINASSTLLEIVNGILDISKIEAGKLEIVNSPYKAKNTFEELAKLITPKMTEKGLDFSYYIAPDIPNTLYGDHANIKKVITNLLSNAAKYTDKGFVRYEVNCINSNNLCKLIISVEDSGRGIKQENVDKLFTKFQRLEEDRNTTIEGTGLGLAITKQLTELMGGKIIVHTVYGEGSKFTVVLNQPIEKVEEKITSTEETQSQTLDLKNVKILIVDDNTLNLKVATKLLERFSANNVTCVESGFLCLDKIGNGENYDVILMDDMMPKMSGSETLKKLKENQTFNIPVIALTANAITGMREKYLSEGFDEYLAKPIEKEELIKAMNKILNNTLSKEEKQETILSEKEVETKEIIPVEENIEEIIGTTQELTPVKESDESFKEREKNELTKEKTDFLKRKGIDLEKALELLGDMEMYETTLKDFAEEADNKWLRIRNYKQASDLENYAIEVHSLKSDSKYLGFMRLAEKAYEHELKSKDNDANFVNNHFNDLEEEFNKVLAIIDEYNLIGKDKFLVIDTFN